MRYPDGKDTYIFPDTLIKFPPMFICSQLIVSEVYLLDLLGSEATIPVTTGDGVLA